MVPDRAVIHIHRIQDRDILGYPISPTAFVDEPYALIGTAEAIAEKLERCRSRWGISYFVVRDGQQFEPVIAELR